jgi:hypothetical protein
MSAKIRKAWDRNGTVAALFAGLFAAPLLAHALARYLA